MQRPSICLQEEVYLILKKQDACFRKDDAS